MGGLVYAAVFLAGFLAGLLAAYGAGLRAHRRRRAAVLDFTGVPFDEIGLMPLGRIRR